MSPSLGSCHPSQTPSSEKQWSLEAPSVNPCFSCFRLQIKLLSMSPSPGSCHPPCILSSSGGRCKHLHVLLSLLPQAADQSTLLLCQTRHRLLHMRVWLKLPSIWDQSTVLCQTRYRFLHMCVCLKVWASEIKALFYCAKLDTDSCTCTCVRKHWAS